jgi:hypothetical protein
MLSSFPLQLIVQRKPAKYSSYTDVNLLCHRKKCRAHKILVKFTDVNDRKNQSVDIFEVFTLMEIHMVWSSGF